MRVMKDVGEPRDMRHFMVTNEAMTFFVGRAK